MLRRSTKAIFLYHPPGRLRHSTQSKELLLNINGFLLTKSALFPSKVAVVVCMDARIDPAKALGISEGDAHIIRNAGGRTIEALRSVVISQQLLGTREIVIVHHVRRQQGAGVG